MKKSFSTVLKGYSMVSILLGIIFTFFGSFVFLTSYMAGIPIILAGVCFISYHQGVYVDMKRNQVKQFYSFFWLRFGSWKSLKDYAYILVSFGNRYVPRYGYVGTFQVFLVPINKEKTPSVLLKNFGSQTKAVKMAELYSQRTGLVLKSNLTSK